ncbi:hypothetical protein GJ496_002334 [Pomphorhynchus laevis]|nr:hypothetical protein GJ496_002334 [Pomphorhynchus laevis]
MDDQRRVYEENQNRVRLCVRNIPRNTTVSKLKKTLRDENVVFKSAKVVSGRTAYITFSNENERDFAQSILSEIDSNLIVRPVGNEILISSCNDQQPPTDEDIKNSIAPLWNLPYKDQLNEKVLKIKQLLKFYLNYRENVYIEEAPLIEKYKGKIEFSVEQCVLGFRANKFKNTKYVRYCQLPLVPDKVHNIALRLQENWLDSKKPLTLHTISVRFSFSTEQVMLILRNVDENMMNDFPLESIKMDDERDSIFYGGSNNNVLTKHKGPGTITESILGCTFEISPLSFFQTNPKVAEQLYTFVIEKVRERQCDIVF